MKLKYFWLWLAFIAPAYGSHKCGPFFGLCKCGEKLIDVNDQKACCPSDKGCDLDLSIVICPNGVIQSFGSYCKGLHECIVKDQLKISIPCKMSDSEDYLCSNETEIHKVCRGTTVTTCKNKK